MKQTKYKIQVKDPNLRRYTIDLLISITIKHLSIYLLLFSVVLILDELYIGAYNHFLWPEAIYVATFISVYLKAYGMRDIYQKIKVGMMIIIAEIIAAYYILGGFIPIKVLSVFAIFFAGLVVVSKKENKDTLRGFISYIKEKCTE